MKIEQQNGAKIFIIHFILDEKLSSEDDSYNVLTLPDIFL